MRRLHLKLILPLLVISLAAGGCGSKAIKNLTREHVTRSNGSTPLRQKYDRLSKGMTRSEVVALMGPPVQERVMTKDGFQFTTLTYAEGNWRGIVVVSPAHGLLVAHSSDDPDFGK